MGGDLSPLTPQCLFSLHQTAPPMASPTVKPKTIAHNNHKPLLIFYNKYSTPTSQTWQTLMTKSDVPR